MKETPWRVLDNHRTPPAASTTTQRGPSGEGQQVSGPEPGRGVYGISVAAELVGMGAQTLRLYETRGLLEPERTPGVPAVTAPMTWTGSGASGS